MALSFLLILIYLGLMALLMCLLAAVVLLAVSVKRRKKPGSVSEEDYEIFRRWAIVSFVLLLLIAVACAVCVHTLSGTTLSM